jgi:hypothetical protein
MVNAESTHRAPLLLRRNGRPRHQPHVLRGSAAKDSEKLPDSCLTWIHQQSRDRPWPGTCFGRGMARVGERRLALAMASASAFLSTTWSRDARTIRRRDVPRPTRPAARGRGSTWHGRRFLERSTISAASGRTGQREKLSPVPGQRTHAACWPIRFTQLKTASRLCAVGSHQISSWATRTGRLLHGRPTAVEIRTAHRRHSDCHPAV